MLNKKGFTLVEIMVAMSIFAIVALIGSSAVISANRVNQKAQAIKIAMDNLHFAMESMTFKLKRGGAYHCGSGGVAGATTAPEPQNCEGGSELAFFTPKSGGDGKVVVYKLDSATGKIMFNDGSGSVPIISDSLNITGLKFYVRGAESGSLSNPSVMITVSGIATVAQGTSDFNLQTMVTERL